MYEPYVNYWAVLVSALVFFGIGAIWYGPLFGKAWLKQMNWTEEEIAKKKAEGKMAGPFAIMGIGSLILALVTAHLIDYMFFVFMGSTPLSIGLTSVCWLWLGYVATYLLTTIAFEGKKWCYLVINGGYWLVGMLAMGAILSLWR